MINQGFSCVKCKCYLEGQPKILMLDEIYCYSCAKKIFNIEQKKRRDDAFQKYSFETANYNARKSEAARFYGNWWDNRINYVERGRVNFFIKGIIIFGISIISEKLNPGYGIFFLTFTLLSFFSYKISKIEDNKRMLQYEKEFPEPTFEESRV